MDILQQLIVTEKLLILNELIQLQNIEKHKIEEQEEEEVDFNKQKRLEKCRITARERRKKKKEELGKIYTVYDEIKNKNNKLKLELSTKGKDFQEQVYEEIKEAKKYGKKGCIFCERVYNEEKTLYEHLKINHSFEIRSSQNIFEENFSLDILSNPEKSLRIINCKLEELGKSYKVIKIKKNISKEEKIKQRLKRNAESAKLCRLRKKLNLQKIRLLIPYLEIENNIMNKNILNS
eukprot:snap_masked-scaffold_23-processed-gene-1.23-mRNA-1 protein AED:0.14 eAED:1.00 QI:0/-1/0/1/-1/1/1/0/234